MKIKQIYAVVVLLFIASNPIFAQIKVNSTGKVGIGDWGSATPSYGLDVKGPSRLQLGTSNNYIWFNMYNGVTPSIIPSSNTINLGATGNRFNYIYSAHALQTSDKRLKENFRSLETPLQNILKTKGLKYDWKEEAFDTDDKALKSKLVEKGKDNMGFLAQDLQKIFPSLVYYDEESDSYAVDYIGMIPVLVEALKEQQVQIELQNKEIEKLQSCCTNNFYKSSNKSTAIEENASVANAALYQNEPNPFTENTVIKFSLPESVESTFIGIYNLNGTQIKSIAITARGESSITVAASELQAGMYFYSLIADGKEVDTKRMVITD